MRGKWILKAGLIVLVAAVLAGCGDDDEETTVTETTTATETTPAPETTATQPSSNGETADLPLCSTGAPRPCRTEGGAVLESGGANGGEIADLPLCSEGPPPCRTPGGELVEP